MFKAILHEKQILIVLLGSILIFIGYNVLTVEASEKNDSPKEICKDYDGKWKDGSCTFPNDNEKQESEVGFDHAMEEKGLWDDYAAKQESKNKKNIVEEEKEPDKTTIVEDWKNEVEVEPIENVKINSPFLMVPIDKDDDEKEIDEKVEKYIADYNEKEEEAVEPQDDGVVEEEEVKESDEDESEDDEQEEDESEEDNSDSES